jgi:hypothetical protein
MNTTDNIYSSVALKSKPMDLCSIRNFNLAMEHFVMMRFEPVIHITDRVTGKNYVVNTCYVLLDAVYCLALVNPHDDLIRLRNELNGHFHTSHKLFDDNYNGGLKILKLIAFSAYSGTITTIKPLSSVLHRFDFFMVTPYVVQNENQPKLPRAIKL